MSEHNGNLSIRITVQVHTQANYQITVPIYTTLVVLSLSLGFWIGRIRNRAYLVNLSRRRTEPPAALLQSRTSTVIDNTTSPRVNTTDSCKMVGRNYLSVHPEPFIILQVLVARTDLGMTSGKIAAQ